MDGSGRARVTPYLLVRHELQRRLGGNFDDVHPVAAPQRSGAALFDHLHEAAHDAHVVCSGAVNLRRNGTFFIRGQFSGLWRSMLWLFNPKSRQLGRERFSVTPFHIDLGHSARCVGPMTFIRATSRTQFSTDSLMGSEGATGVHVP